MKFIVLATCLFGAYLIGEVRSQVLGNLAAPVIPPAVPPVIPPLLPMGPLGMLGALGPLGMMGALGPLGLMGALGPLGLMGPLGMMGMLRFGLLGPRLLGKRSVEGVNGTEPVVPSTVKCTLDSTPERSFLNCTDFEQSIKCDLVPRLTGIENVRLSLPDVIVRPGLIDGVEVLKLFTRKSFGKHTFVHPVTNESVVVSLFSSESVAQPGFLFKDVVCFSELAKLVAEVPDRFRFSVVVQP